MKKLLLVFCFILPLTAFAQDFKTLVHQGDSLWKKSKYQKAKVLYEKAIERVVTYQDIVNNHQWFYVCTKAAELSGNNFAKYAPSRYFVDGEKFKEKIADLNKQHVYCIFTYKPYVEGGTGSSYFIDSTKKFQFVPSDNKRLLIWATDSSIFMQAFGDNVYRPLKMNSPQLLDFLKENNSKLALEEIGRQHPKWSDGLTAFAFKFYWGGAIYGKYIHEPANLTNPKQNEGTYLGKLLPMVQTEATSYYSKVKTE